MQEHEVRELFERLREAMDPAQEYQERHEDYLVEFPQSGERLDRDGRMWRETRYYAEPFEVPAWRASWSKPVLEEPVAAP